MTNLFGELYKQIADHLKASVAELRWIDQDFGQLEHFEIRPEVSFPCALIDFPATNYSNMAELTQFGELTINIRLGFAPFSSSHQLAPGSVKDLALKYYDIEQKIYEAMQGWQAMFPAGDPAEGQAFTQHCIRISSVTEQRDQDGSALRVRVLTFTTAFEDLSALQTYTKQAATAEINIKD